MVDADVMVIGAGAAGLMCASEAGKRGRRILLLDHAQKLGEKIRISGGRRCNFTNLYTAREAFLSANPHFYKSALRQYDQHDFISLVNKHKIAHHEKKLGQLFCDESSQNIIDMLKNECDYAGVALLMDCQVNAIDKREDGFHITLDVGLKRVQCLVIAIGGLSIPKIGATGFGYQIAQQFRINFLDQRPGLVPLVFDKGFRKRCKIFLGLSLDARVAHAETAFQEGRLFTHRRLSGPSILQISFYWRDTQSVSVNLSPAHDASVHLINGKARQPRQDVATCLADFFAKTPCR